MSVTADQIVSFLRESLDVDTSAFGFGDPLFSAGIIDSFALVSILTFVEESCGVRIAPNDVTLENFDSVDRIVAFVARANG